MEAVGALFAAFEGWQHGVGRLQMI